MQVVVVKTGGFKQRLPPAVSTVASEATSPTSPTTQMAALAGRDRILRGLRCVPSSHWPGRFVAVHGPVVF